MKGFLLSLRRPTPKIILKKSYSTGSISNWVIKPAFNLSDAGCTIKYYGAKKGSKGDKTFKGYTLKAVLKPCYFRLTLQHVHHVRLIGHCMYFSAIVIKCRLFVIRRGR